MPGSVCAPRMDAKVVENLSKASLGSFCADAITTCDTGTCNQTVQRPDLRGACARPTGFPARGWGPSRPLLRGWGFRAQETHKRMKDKAVRSAALA